MINYSFIIPHKNSLSLLHRCIASIPHREDVEIIVVDDNSCECEKPCDTNDYVKIIYVDEKNSQGAGKARNIGISYASGRWLLFPDADDFYEDGFLDCLDQYCKKEDLQILFFSCKGVDTMSLKPHPCADRVQWRIEQYDGTPHSLNIVKYQTHVPWCKMIRRDFVMKYRITYDEVKKGNDVKFSYLTSYFSNKIEVLKDRLYVYTFNKNSITHAQRSIDGSLSIRINQAKSKKFLEYIGLPDLHCNIPLYNTAFSVLKHMGISSFIRFIFSFGQFRRNMKWTMFDYIATMETIKVQQRLTQNK